MKCPKCGFEGYKFVEKKAMHGFKDKAGNNLTEFKRYSNKTFCSHCNFSEDLIL